MTHASVFLDNDKEDIPSEDIDERSLSRVKDTIIPRASITSNIKMYTSVGNKFKGMKRFNSFENSPAKSKYTINKLKQDK
jgi:hypothetical protein